MLPSRQMSRALCVVLLLASSVARADVESERVRAGLTAFQKLQYERAVSLLEQSLAESLTREEKVAVFRTLGFCRVALDRPDEARRDFARLLAIDPSVELDARASPRVRAIFEAARAELAQHGPKEAPSYRLPEVTLRLEPSPPREGEPLTVSLVHGGGLARRAQLFARVRGEPSFARFEYATDAQGAARFVMPGVAVRPPAIEHYAVVLDEAGAAIARAGSLAAPLAVLVRARPVPLWKRRWFWGVIGGTLAAALVAGIITAAVLSAPASVTLLPQ